MQFIIVGEDELTRNVIKCLISKYCPKSEIAREDPVRGGQIQSLMPNYNLLAVNRPVFVLSDSDAECPPEIIEHWLLNQPLNKNLLFRMAVDEVESWLLADRIGIARYLGVALSYIPQPSQKGTKTEISYSLNYKSSLYMMKDIIPHSNKKIIKEKLLPKYLAKKGPEYNSGLLPFLKYWNIQQAASNSSSLNKTILRLENFYKSYINDNP